MSTLEPSQKCFPLVSALKFSIIKTEMLYCFKRPWVVNYKRTKEKG